MLRPWQRRRLETLSGISGYHSRRASVPRDSAQHRRREPISMTVVRHWLAVASVVALLATGWGAGSIALAQDQGSPGLEATRTARVQPEQTPESDTTPPDVAQTDDQSSDGESASPD